MNRYRLPLPVPELRGAQVATKYFRFPPPRNYTEITSEIRTRSTLVVMFMRRLPKSTKSGHKSVKVNQVLLSCVEFETKIWSDVGPLPAHSDVECLPFLSLPRADTAGELESALHNTGIQNAQQRKKRARNRTATYPERPGASPTLSHKGLQLMG